MRKREWKNEKAQEEKGRMEKERGRGGGWGGVGGGVGGCVVFFFFKQKTAYEIYQCDWSSDVCSSDLREV